MANERKRGRKKKKGSVLLEECRREIESQQKMGIKIPNEILEELEEIERKVESGNLSPAAQQISALMEKLRVNKENEIKGLKERVEEVYSFLTKHGISCEECEKILGLLESSQISQAKEIWEKAKEEIEHKISKIKRGLEEVKSVNELIEYTSTHKIDVENEKLAIAKVEEMLLEGKIDEAIERCQELKSGCKEKLRKKFEEEVKKVEDVQIFIPGLGEVLAKAWEAFENGDYYSAFGGIASAYARLSSIDANKLKATIADLKILIDEIKPFSAYLAYIEECEKEIAMHNMEKALRMLSYLKREAKPVFERDFGRIIARIQAISQTLSMLGIQMPEEFWAEAENYRAKEEYGKAMVNARLALENAEKSAKDIVNMLKNSFIELYKQGIVEGISLQDVKKIEELLASDVLEALNFAFQIKVNLDNEIRKRIEPFENSLLALEKIVNEMEEVKAEANPLILKTRGFIASYRLKDAEKTLEELKEVVERKVLAKIRTELPKIKKDMALLGTQQFEKVLEEVQSFIEQGDFYNAWLKYKEVSGKLTEVYARTAQERMQSLKAILEEFAKVGIKLSLPAISPSDSLAMEKIDNFVNVSRDSIKELLKSKIENGKKVFENANKMGIKIDVNLSDFTRLLDGEVFCVECAKGIAKLNEKVEEASKAMEALALKEIELMEAIKEKFLSLGLKSERYEKRMELAHERIEKGLVYEAWFVANRVITEMKKDLHQKFSEEIDYLNKILNKIGKDSNRLAMKVELEDAKILLAKEDYIALADLLRKIQEKLNKYIEDAVKEEFAKIEKNVENAVKAGIVAEEYKAVLSGIQSKLNEGRLIEAEMEIKETKEFLEKGFRNAYENMRSEVEKKLYFCEKIGVDLDINLEKIDEIFNEDYISGLEQIKDARERVIKHLQAFISSEISKLRSQIRVCIEKGIDCKVQSLMLDDATQWLERGGIEESYTLLIEAKKSLLSVLEEVIKNRLLEAKRELERLKGIELPLEDAEAMLKEAQELLERGEIVKAYATYLSLRKELDSILKKYFPDILEHYKRRLKDYQSLEFEMPRSKEMLARIEPKAEDIEKLESTINAEVVEILNQKISLARANIEVIEKYLQDSHYKILIENAANEVNSGNIVGGIRAMREFSEAYALLKDRFYDYIKELKERNNILAEIGLAVENLALEIENFERSVEQNHFYAIEKRLIEWEVYLRGVLSDRLQWELGELRKALEYLAKDEEIGKLLDEASMLVEEQRYGEARAKIVKARLLLAEQGRKQFEDEYNKLMLEIERCSGVGIDTSQAERFIENFRAEVGAMNFYAAKWNLENAKEALLRAEQDSASNAIKMLSLAIEPYSSIFPDDFIKYSKLLEQAMVLFKENKFVEATRLAYKTNFEFITTISQKIRSTIEYTRKVIEEFSQRGVDMEAARNLLNESIYYFNSSDFISAVQKASQARAVAEDYLRVYINQKFGELLSLIKEAKALGVETKKIEEGLEVAQRLFEEGKYLDCGFALTNLSVDCISQMQRKIESKISEIEKIGQEFVTNGILIPTEFYLYLERAKYSASYGQFGLANGDVESARKMLLDILGSMAAEKILNVKKIGDMGISIGCPMKATLKNYQELTEAMAKIEVSKVIEICRSIEADAWKELSDYIHSLIFELKSLIEIGKQYSLPHATISDAISQAELYASWHNYPTAYQLLTNAKKVISELLAPAMESKLEEMKAMHSMLSEILGIRLGEDFEKCKGYIREQKLSDAHLQLKKIEEEIVRLGNDERLKKFVENRFSYAKSLLDGIKSPSQELSQLLAKAEEYKKEKDYLRAALKLNTFLKNLSAHKALENHGENRSL